MKAMISFLATPVGSATFTNTTAGVTLFLPSWQAYTLEGKLIEENGVEPDIEVLINKEDLQKKDVLFEKVISLIKQKN